MAREAIRDGRDPSAERKGGKVRAVLPAETTFEAIARESLDKQRAKLAPVTFAKAGWLLGMANSGIGRDSLCRGQCPRYPGLVAE